MSKRYVLALAAALAVLVASRAVGATTWQSLAGAQSFDEAIQVEAFLPNELWVHVGDSITWTFPAGEIHTVTLLKPGQVRPSAGTGCPGTTPDQSSYDGSTCATSAVLMDGQTYTVNFPTAGNFKVVCLVHANMTGAVHVLEQSEALPYQQTFYDDQAYTQRVGLLKDGGIQLGLLRARAQQNPGYQVNAGSGEIVATGGGSHTVSVYRFTPESIVVNVGDTVEWTNVDPVTAHTVTFGTEPSGPPQPPSAGVTVDSDGARHAVLASPGDSVHSGFIVAAPQDRIGLAQANLGVTRFRVTFTTPGTFDYICALHDEVGMTGRVIFRQAGR
jgi:plastocyanin